MAAPFATRQLADLGARVIKIERLGRGDFARDYDSAAGEGMSSWFVWLNRAQESVVLDLKAEDGRRALDSLIGRAESSSVTSRQRPSAGWAWKRPS